MRKFPTLFGGDLVPYGIKSVVRGVGKVLPITLVGLVTKQLTKFSLHYYRGEIVNTALNSSYNNVGEK